MSQKVNPLSGEFDIVQSKVGKLKGVTAGSLLFVGDDLKVTEDNSNLFFDDTNDSLGIGVASPDDNLHIDGALRFESSTGFSAAKAGRMYYNSGVGLALQGKAGSSFNLALFTPNGQQLLVNKKNTDNINLVPGSVGGLVGINTEPAGTQFSIRNKIAANVGMTLRMASSQTGNAFVFTNSSGVPMNYFNSVSEFVNKDNSKLWFGTGLDASINYDGTDLVFNSAEVGSGTSLFEASGSTIIPLTIKGAVSQNANLLTLLDSSDTVLSAFNKDGWLGVGTDNPISPLETRGMDGVGNTILIQSDSSAGRSFLLHQYDNFATRTGNGIQIITKQGATDINTIASWSNTFTGVRGHLNFILDNIMVGDANDIPTEKVHIKGSVYLDADNDKFILGGGKDSSIYYNNTDMIIDPKEAGSGILSILGAVGIEELSADPTDPAEGKAVFWKSDGTDTGDDGDLLYKEQSNSVVSQGSLKWKDFVASSGTIVEGDDDGGDYTDTQVMFDGNYWVIGETSGAAPNLDVRLNFTNVDRNPTMVIARWIYNGGAGHEITIEIYNYNTTAWDVLRVFSDSDYPGSITMYLPRNVNGDYVDDSGNAMIRFYHQSTGIAAHQLQLDYVGLTHSLQGVI